ncbi:ovarian cancer G-protein coupled receptor 1 [Pristis pectinata]|uniref:ovarian cancer G-protein coupled receptor 1 n=1 Tax=Pristis pectinata TaxID=685728 RepID=UPI00223CCC34|nr:ovarian cancer G-protein coupled receptor 1 [Pristis pectinata]XP_051886017.1 ovarian cancer G-protein coupled receptor 1 [Pristis pectinata]XP_051886111.1 ovarian cancer G-protein coupled receptor 1 [Pristis pectinata]
MANQGQCNEANCTNCSLDYSVHQGLFSAVYIFIFIISLPTSLLSLYHSYLQMRQRNELGVYLCNLTISDLLHLACLPLWIQYLLKQDNWVHGEFLCRLTGLVLYENIYVSIAFLCCISMDRYLAVVYPLRFHSLRTMKAAVLVSVLVWSKEIGTSLFIFNHNETVKDQNNHILCFEHYPLEPWQRNVNYYRLSVGFLLPIILLSFLYHRVLTSINKSESIQQDQKLRIKKLVLSAIAIFCICFAPYHIFLMIRTLFENDCSSVKKLFHFYHVGLLLTSLNCVADPLLYTFVSESTRGILMRLLEPMAKLMQAQEMEQIDTPKSCIINIQTTSFTSRASILSTPVRIGTWNES